MLRKRINSKWTKWYETTYFKNGVKYAYITKSLTSIHDVIHEEASKRGDYAQTMMKDKTVEWPFGLYAEIIKTTKGRMYFVEIKDK